MNAVFKSAILNEQQFNFICDKKWWIKAIHEQNFINEIIIVLNYNYNGFISLINKIDKQLHIKDDILHTILLSKYDNDKLDLFFYDLWFTH
jgi:hypothetical protein